jgi:hypothetical protein
MIDSGSGFDWMAKKKLKSKDGVFTSIHPGLKKNVDILSAEFQTTKFEAGGLIGEYLKDNWDDVVDDMLRRQRRKGF